MNLAELRFAFRVRTDDVAEPFLWGDDELALYFSEAESEAAQRASLIQDSTTPAVATIAITIGPADYALSPLILSVERVALASQTSDLTRTTAHELDTFYPGWRAATGQPRYFIEDNGRIMLVPKSPVADMLYLTVFRLPLAALVVDSDAPEIHQRHHYRLIDWALRCAYLKQDSETKDEQKAAQYEQSFGASFGYRQDANVQRKQRTHRPTIVKMNW